MRNTLIIIFFYFTIVFGVEKYALVYISDITQNKTTILIQNGFDVDHSINFNDNRIELVTPRNKIHQLDELGIDFSIEQNDLESFYASRLETNSARDFENGSMGGYFTFDEIFEFIDGLTNECPEIISEKTPIGQSLEGRDIWMVRVSDNPNIDENEPEVLYTGLHHSREPMSYMNLLYFMNWLCENYSSDQEVQNIVNNRELYFVPVVNPDGLIYNEFYAPNGGGLQRKNGLETCSNNNNDDLWDGVDLNRNYGFQWGHDDEGSSPEGCDQTYRGSSPFSEPETEAIKNFVENHDFKIALNYHSYSNILIYPFGWEYNLVPPEEDYEIFTEFGQEMTQFNGYEMGTGPELLYPVNGEACDWMYGQHGIIAYTPEIGSFMDGFWPATDRIIPLAEQNLHPNKFVATAVGPMYEFSVEINDGPYESGNSYSVGINVSNKGLSNSYGDIILNIDTSWEINVIDESINLNSLDSRQEILLDQLFNFSINPNVADGALGNLTLTIQDDEGIEYQQSINILIGTPISVVNQTFEQEDDLDWFVGDDDATAGNWEWGEPNGTELNGVIIQPYSDHSEFGNSCFVTGNSNGQSNPGYDDIDGGTTTLYSPIYNLIDYEVAFVSYWRWFNNDMGDNPGNDRWIVEVTNNGGMNWIELENTTESVHNWVNKQFILSLPDFDLSPMVQFRFIAQDIYHEGDNGNGGSLVEAALDDFEISAFTESPILFGDVNNDHLLNIMDVITIINFILDITLPNSNEAFLADFDQSGEINVLDVVGIVNQILAFDQD